MDYTDNAPVTDRVMNDHVIGDRANRDSPDQKLGPQREAPKGWSRPLARPVALRDGASLVTLADVRSFLFKRMQINRKETPDWQRVVALLLSAVRSDEVDVADVTAAVRVSDDDVADYHARNPLRFAARRPGRHGWRAPSLVGPPLGEVRSAISDHLRGAARRRAFRVWLDARRAALVRLAPGYEHPGDPRQPDNTHRH